MKWTLVILIGLTTVTVSWAQQEGVVFLMPFVEDWAQQEEAVAEPLPQEEPDTPPPPQPPRQLPVVAIKTNLFALNLLRIVNVAAEVEWRTQAGNRWSVNVPLLYSPYTVERDYNVRLLALQPELRRWWNNDFFVGVHLHLVYYNVAVDAYHRYQTKEGSGLYPLWVGGVSGGYRVECEPLWLEFTIGVGYARTTYDVFDNTVAPAKGKWLYEGKSDYLGITKLGINVVYVFGNEF
jgi:hypothetical protein